MNSIEMRKYLIEILEERIGSFQIPRDSVSDFLDLAGAQGPLPLIGYALRNLTDIPYEVAERLKFARHQNAALLLEWDKEIEQLCYHLSSFDALILKGAAYSELIYPTPELRTRDDTDLLIRRGDREAVVRILLSLGFLPQSSADGDLIRAQKSFTKICSSSVEFTLDLHWELTDLHIFKDTIHFDELYERSIPLTKFGGRAATLREIDSAVYAAIHAVAHHGSNASLIWMYDLMLLLDNRSDEWYEEFIVVSTSFDAGVFVAESIRKVKEVFSGLIIPSDLINRLEHSQSRSADLQRQYVSSKRDLFSYMRLQFRGLNRLIDRLSYLIELGFPGIGYMQDRSGTNSILTIACMYFTRIFKGILRLSRP